MKVKVNEQPIAELVELVRSRRVSPWEVDVGKLLDIYESRVFVKQRTDLRIPVRVLHSAATLLRIKSEWALNGSGNGREEAEDLEDILEVDLPALGELAIEYFVPCKLTLDDLLGALRAVVSEMPKRKEKDLGKPQRLKLDVSHDVDVKLEEMMRGLMKKIETMERSGKTPSLFSLVDGRKREEVVLVFYLLLFLCSDGVIALEQPEPFGDIVVRMRGERANGGEGG